MPNFNGDTRQGYFTKIVFVSDALRGFAQWSAEKKASDAGNEVIAISAIARFRV